MKLFSSLLHGKKPFIKAIKLPSLRFKKGKRIIPAAPKKRKRLFILMALLILMAMVFTVSGPGKAIIASASKRDLPIYCVQKDSKVVSLSFDAAWGNEDTEQLIDILGKYSIKATFFVVGEWVDKYPESVKSLSDAGHEIMNHSNTHAHFPKLSNDQIIADINACNDKIEAITGVRPTLFRPPYGDYSDKVVATLREIGMYTIQWDVDSLDWKDLKAEAITKRVVERVNPGSIILFHNAAKLTPEALPDIIESLIQKGYDFVPISKLILTENFEIDHTGKQCPKTSAS